MINTDISIYVPVYNGEKTIEKCVNSILNQTLKPNIIVIVIDGPIEKWVELVLKNYKKILPIKTLRLKKNFGLGLALRKGLVLCQSDIVLRFDTDDINLPERAFYQVRKLSFMNLDIVGSNIFEFSEESNKFVSKKRMPLKHNNIFKL